ncbi:TetR/AcrR family transcriptional regulator [Proteiniclasticum ruminis]|uniref:TetR/AcrR family transcriptional regulator, fatty acid metabolism regulator protein n=1 Tax=Proteiniclasticum ruminis TaxID=398199 RepID=A0A1G8LLN6_9CLOT|nr:TetR/AcrR family transcriptional regulator [Proteiniclasticum ruminis]SDI56621.1 TetR/AcrR family transcriptional regulator, fatty acid metabolism regulator protein [Proteiniclasticum ruminis]
MNKKELIRLSATKIIAEEGFYKTKVQDIADDAEIAVGTVYIYFKNKDDILDYIFESQHTKMSEFIERLEKEEISPLEKIKRILRYHFKEMENHPDLAKVLSQEGTGSLKNQDSEMKDDSLGVPDIFQKMLEDSKEIGEIRDIDAEMFGYVIFFVGRETAYLLQIKGKRDRYYKAFEELLTFIVNGIKV